MSMQGFRSFVWTAVSYQLKDKLKLSPSASQFVSAVAFFPWSIKPLYGYEFLSNFIDWPLELIILEKKIVILNKIELSLTMKKNYVYTYNLVSHRVYENAM